VEKEKTLKCVSPYNMYLGALCDNSIGKTSIDRRITRAHVRVTFRSKEVFSVELSSYNMYLRALCDNSIE